MQSQHAYKGTGYAFITYNFAANAAIALKEHSKLASRTQKMGIAERFRTNKYKDIEVRKAPEPYDINWENLEYSDWERRFRSIASSAFIVVMAGLGTTILLWANAIQPIDKMSNVPFIFAWLWQTILMEFKGARRLTKAFVLIRKARFRAEGKEATSRRRRAAC